MVSLKLCLQLAVFPEWSRSIHWNDFLNWFNDSKVLEMRRSKLHKEEGGQNNNVESGRELHRLWWDPHIFKAKLTTFIYLNNYFAFRIECNLYKTKEMLPLFLFFLLCRCYVVKGSFFIFCLHIYTYV